MSKEEIERAIGKTMVETDDEGDNELQRARDV